MVKYTDKLILNSHELDGSNASGNGHHGSCRHCGVPLVTDLGYCSWEGVPCIDRVTFMDLHDFPTNIRSYATFNGLRFDKKRQLFVKPYSRTYTVMEVAETVQELLNNR